MARRLVPLPGGVAIRHPALIPLLRCSASRVSSAASPRRHPGELVRVLALSPLLLAGYAVWAGGFWKGARDPLDVR